jgi:hypothetical protein
VNRTAWLVISVTGWASLFRLQNQRLIYTNKQKLPLTILMMIGNFYDFVCFLRFTHILILRLLDRPEETGWANRKLVEVE